MLWLSCGDLFQAGVIPAPVTLHRAPAIFDPDLVAEPGRLLKTIFSDFRIRQLEQEQTKRNAPNAMPPGRQRREQTAEQTALTNPSTNDPRHIHSVLAICTLPYERVLTDQREFEPKQGSMALDVPAGFLRDPSGEKIPSQSRSARRLGSSLMHLCSDSILQKSPTIEIAETLTSFVRDMGFPDSGDKKGPVDGL